MEREGDAHAEHGEGDAQNLRAAAHPEKGRRVEEGEAAGGGYPEGEPQRQHLADVALVTLSRGPRQRQDGAASAVPRSRSGPKGMPMRTRGRVGPPEAQSESE